MRAALFSSVCRDVEHGRGDDMFARLSTRHLLSLMPSSLVMARGNSDALYLTFDDGPHPEHTPALLDELARHDAKATFFVIGNQIEGHIPLLQRVLAEGHALGNHSYSHPQFAELSLAAQVEEIARTDALLAGLTGQAQALFRPPRGEVSAGLLWHFARRRRRIAYWSRDSGDYQGGDGAALAEGLRSSPPGAGDILLMHDDGGTSLALMKALLPEWRERGLHCVALSGV